MTWTTALLHKNLSLWNMWEKRIYCETARMQTKEASDAMTRYYPAGCLEIRSPNLRAWSICNENLGKKRPGHLYWATLAPDVSGGMALTGWVLQQDIHQAELCTACGMISILQQCGRWFSFLSLFVFLTVFIYLKSKERQRGRDTHRERPPICWMPT